MKLPRRRWVVGALVVAALICAGWFFFGHNGEPRYEGKPVSYWFKEYYSPQHQTETDSNSHDVAIEALRAMGSNALPYLVQVAFSTNEDSPARTNFYNLLAKLPDSWNLPRLIAREDIRGYAMNAVQEIGPSAGDVLPLIRTELRQTNTFQHRKAIIMLTFVTNEVELAVPYLAGSLSDTNKDVRSIALFGLADFGPKASPALPDLLRVLEGASSADPEVINVLECIGSNAIPAIPRLKLDFENETNWSVRCDLASCLFKIDSKQIYALDYLIGVLTNDATSKRISKAADSLSEIGPNAKASIPALLDVLKATNWNFGAEAPVMRALRRVGASSDQVLPLLKLKVDSDSTEMRNYALGQISNFDPSGGETESVLLDLIRKHSTNEMWAIAQLGGMGSRVREAGSVLKQEMDGTNNEISVAAKNALWKIDPKAVGQ
jgi:HEAT repeat protein